VRSPQRAGPGVWDEALASERVQSVLQRAHTVGPVTLVGEVPSTQDAAAGLAAAGSPSGSIVLAERQTAGRGRGGRAWDDAERPGASLALTLVLDVPTSGVSVVPHAAGLALHDALVAVGAGPPQVQMLALKWPNDLVVRATTDAPPRKLAGILVEREHAGTREVLLVGVGLNVDHRDVRGPDDRTSVAAIIGGSIDRAHLLAALLEALDGRLALTSLADPRTMADYRRASDTIGRSVRVDLPMAPSLVGTAVGIDDAGRLIVESGGERHMIVAGTVRDE